MLVGAGAEALTPEIRNAGELLFGPDTPFAAANYAIGVSAVLPTIVSLATAEGLPCHAASVAER